MRSLSLPLPAQAQAHAVQYSSVVSSTPMAGAPQAALPLPAYQPPHDVLIQSLKALPDAIGAAVTQANAPMQDLLLLAQNAVKGRQPTRMQAIATVINRWALPVVQVLLGAAVLAVGVTTMEISIMVIGATMCATGLALCLTLLAGCLAPHPLDAVKEFVQRRQQHDPKAYEPGQLVMLDGGT
jgi:hypothetical protein